MSTARNNLLTFLLVAAMMTGGGGCSKKAQVNDHLKRANREFEAQHYQEAEIEYRNVLQIVPMDLPAIRQLGIIYYEQGILPKAYAYLRKAAQLEPEKSEVQRKLGLIYLSLRKFTDAREAALQVLRREPGQEEGLLLLADTARAPQEIEETELLIEQLRQGDRERIGYYLALGTLYLRQQELIRAETEFKKALDLDPKSSSVHFALGNLSWARYHLQQADEEFKIATESTPVRSAMRLRYIDFQLRTGAEQDAKRALEEITRQAPDDLSARVYLMKIAFEEGRQDEGSALAQTILAQDPADYDALLQMGNLSLARNDASAAVTQFEHMESLYGRFPQVQYRLALAYLLGGNNPKAKLNLQKAIDLDPNFDEAVLLLADLQIKQGDISAALAALKPLVAQQPENAQAHLLLARAYLSQENYDQALAVYHRMQELFPRNPQIPALVGMVLAKKGQPADARNAFEKSLEISPDYLPALEQLVDLDLLETKYAIALDRINKQIEKNAKNAGAWLLEGKIYLAQHDPDNAERCLLKATDLDAKLQAAYLLLAQLYLASDRKEQALEKLTTLVAQTDDLDALTQIGVINNELKHYDAAREAYEKLLAVRPKSAQALNNLACLYSQHLGQLDKSYEIATKAREISPDDPYTADTLGWILFQKADYSRALGLLQESAEKLPAEPEIQFHCGMALYMLGEEDAARDALQRAVSATGDFPEQEEARRRLDWLAIDAKTVDPTVLADLQRHVLEEPNDFVALNRLAAIQERDGALDEAAKNYEAVLKQSPRNTRVMCKLAQLYASRLHDAEKALGLAENAHKIDPKDPAITWTLGHLVFNAGDYRRGLSLLEEAERNLPDQPKLMYDLAWAYYSVGQVPEAATVMQRALQSGLESPQREDAEHFVALVAALESPAEAEAMLPQVDTILNANPTYVPALMVSALVREQRGSYQEAIALYEKALASYPLFVGATRQLAVLYAQASGDDDKAYEFAVKAHEAFPKDPKVSKTLGILDYRRREYQLSAFLLQDSAEKQGDDPELLYYLGMANYQLKAWNESKDALQRALVLNIPPKLADDAKRVLAELKSN